MKYDDETYTIPVSVHVKEAAMPMELKEHRFICFLMVYGFDHFACVLSRFVKKDSFKFVVLL
jgi:hypothetical protein